MKLQVHDLKKSYRQADQLVPVIKNVSFQVGEGETVAILGQSGSGKTTLLSLLAGLDQPDQGDIILNQTSLVKLSEDQRTDFRGLNIGIVFQSYHLVPHLTALENVMLPLEILGIADPRGKAMSWLESVGLASRAKHLPAQLSGGESQRAALARALVTAPKLLLADEPSGHLDQETGARVMDLFFKVARENSMTTLLVTHDENLAKRCDRQLYLRGGVLSS